ncbi:MAG: hypothetical protein QGF87_04815 [Woeseiaceae bacterium]|nr:hypothetical protein [Woeseiaceae bacterium]
MSAPIDYDTPMLVSQWILEYLKDEHRNFAMLRAALAERGKAHPLPPTEKEIRIALARLIRDGRVESCQFLAEDQCFGPAEYSERSIHFYWFRTAASDEKDQRGA